MDPMVKPWGDGCGEVEARREGEALRLFEKGASDPKDGLILHLSSVLPWLDHGIHSATSPLTLPSPQGARECGGKDTGTLTHLIAILSVLKDLIRAAATPFSLEGEGARRADKGDLLLSRQCSSTSTARTVGRWRAISDQVSPSSRLAKTEPELVPK